MRRRLGAPPDEPADIKPLIAGARRENSDD